MISRLARRRRRALGVSAARRSAGSSATSTTSFGISPRAGVGGDAHHAHAQRRRRDPLTRRSIRAHHASSRCRTARFRSPAAAARPSSIAARPIRCSACGPAAPLGSRARRARSISSTASARACSATRDGGRASAAPLVLNPQGLEEFGATDPSRRRLKRAGYLPLRRAVLACARAADRVIATDRVARAGRALAPRSCRRSSMRDDPERARSRSRRSRCATGRRAPRHARGRASAGDESCC